NGVDDVYYDQALQQIGAVNTSIYPTLSEAEMEYILNDSGARTLLVGNPFLLKKILKIANNCPALFRIIPTFDDYQKLVSDRLNAGMINLGRVTEEGRNILADYVTSIKIAREAIIPSDLSA